MSEFRLRRIKDTGVYERYEVIGFTELRVHSLHYYWNRNLITGYALVNTVTGNYIHAEPRLVDLRAWMTATDLDFAPAKKKKSLRAKSKKMA